MIETCNKYPKPEMLERLAAALEVEPYQLFSASDILDEPFKCLHQAIVTDMKQIVREALQETFTAECKPKGKKTPFPQAEQNSPF